jgi:hypothetical protein
MRGTGENKTCLIDSNQHTVYSYLSLRYCQWKQGVGKVVSIEQSNIMLKLNCALLTDAVWFHIHIRINWIVDTLAGAFSDCWLHYAGWHSSKGEFMNVQFRWCSLGIILKFEVSVQFLHYKPVSNHLLGGGGRGVGLKSVSRGNCEYCE